MTKRKAGTASRAQQPPVPPGDGDSASPSSVGGSGAEPPTAPAAGSAASGSAAGGSAAGGVAAGGAAEGVGAPALDASGGDGSGDAGLHAPQDGFTVPAAAPVGGRKPAVAGGPLDIAITIGGLVVAVLLAVMLGMFEAFLAPLHVSDFGFSSTGNGNMRIPLALVLALVTNPLLGWFAFTTSGRRFAALLPAAAWCVVWILAAGRTTEGDLLITNDNWVGLLTLFAGPLAFAVGIYVSALRQRAAAPANSEATPLAPQSVDR